MRLLERADALLVRREQLGIRRRPGLSGRREQRLLDDLLAAVAADQHDGVHDQLIGAVARLRLAAIDHGVAEAAHVAARLPDARIHQHGRVEADHRERARGVRRGERLVVVRDHVVPPRLLDVALELDAERPVVPAAVEAAVDLARREDESAPLAERHELVHGNHRVLRVVADPAPGKRGSIAALPRVRETAAAHRPEARRRFPFAPS